MTKLLASVTTAAAAVAPGTLTTILASQTAYENLYLQLRNLGATAATVAVTYVLADATILQISSSAVALPTAAGAPTADFVEIPIRALNPGDAVKITVISAAGITVRALLWGSPAVPART